MIIVLQPSRSSKVVCSFQLVISSNLGPPVLHRFRDIVGFLLKTNLIRLFHPNFGDNSLGLDRRCLGSEERGPYTLTIRVINFELRQPIYTAMVHQRYRQTDRRIDVRRAVKTVASLLIN